MSRRLRVLALAPYPASAPSTRFRLVQLVPLLAELGVDVTVRPFLDEDAYARVRGRRGGAAAALAAAVARLPGTLRAVGDHDVVLVQRGVSLALDRWLPSRLAGRGVPMVYDFDDAVFLPQEGGRGWLERLRDPGGSTRAFCRGAAVVLAGNPFLADFARDAVGPGGEDRVRVLPSVVDPRRLVPAGPRPAESPPTLGWVGSDSTIPYLEALAPALRALADAVPHRLLVVAGSRRPRLEGAAFDFARWTPEGEADLLASLDVGLYPLDDTPWGRGKCGFKALQYLACGVPCVASPVGVLRDIVRPGVTGFHATSTGEWVEACARLLRDRGERARMGAAGRGLVEASYSLEVAAPRLAAALHDAVGLHHA